MMTWPQSYFEERYSIDPDPWSFARSEYEQRKYLLTLASLPRRRFSRAFEPGCSIGVLTRLLAGHCRELISYEIVSSVVEAARMRVKDLAHVRVEQRRIPREWPPGIFDLVVFSEVLYYLDEPEMETLLGRLERSLEPGGVVLAVHYRGPTHYPQSGDAVHEQLEGASFLRPIARYDETDFRISVLEKLTS